LEHHLAHISNQFFLHGLRTTLYGVLLYLVGSGSAAAQADYGAQLAELVQHQLAAEAEVEAAEADCQGTWDAVRQYIGPVSNPLEPRDKACKDHVESSGRRVEGFGDCSSRFFAAYDEHHKKYRICFDRQSTAIENLINIHKKRLDLDRVARAVARTNGNAPAEPNGEKGWLGVRYSGISGKDMERFGLATDQGVIVTKLRDDSPAMRAGILEDDVITSVNDDPVVDRKSFGQAMKGLQAGQMIVLDIIRTGERRFTYVAIEVR
jgi:C-terminal processing protease CtpA/Prc